MSSTTRGPRWRLTFIAVLALAVALLLPPVVTTTTTEAAEEAAAAGAMATR